MTAAGGAAESPPPVAIVCGSGRFPLAVAAEAQRAGRTVFMIGLVGAADPAIAAYPHVWLRLGEFGKLLKTLQDQAIVELALIGALERPQQLADIWPDFGTFARLPEIARLLIGGDDHLLRGILRLFEKEGLRILGAHELAPTLLAPAGSMTPRPPPPSAAADLRLGRDCLAALADFDVGQALVVGRGRIVAIEAAEGTDAMLHRVAELRHGSRLRAKGRLGLLVKAPKTNQDDRIDLPAIGRDTVAAAARARLEGIAVAAGKVLLLEREQLIADAAAADLFVFGFEPRS
jgi:DUF1009 family protein